MINFFGLITIGVLILFISLAFIKKNSYFVKMYDCVTKRVICEWVMIPVVDGGGCRQSARLIHRLHVVKALWCCPL